MTAPHVDWLYVRLYTGPSQNTDALLPAVAQWVTERGPTMRWHFLRYLDPSGVHLRLRLCADPDAVDLWYLALAELESAVGCLRAEPLRRLVADPAGVTVGTRTGLSLGVYSPEREKYGVGADLVVAEDHFHRASQWCVDHRVWTMSLERRAALAAAYLARLAAALGPDILLAHRTQWGGRLRMAGMPKEGLQLVMQHVAREWRESSPDRLVADLVASHLHASAYGSSPLVRALHLAHMDLNRLGLNPAEECVAGLVAAAATTTGLTEEGTHHA